jgi:hypothetical protein
MDLKDIAEEIVEAVNETTNDYDAREIVLNVLIANMEELEEDG